MARYSACDPILSCLTAPCSLSQNATTSSLNGPDSDELWTIGKWGGSSGVRPSDASTDNDIGIDDDIDPLREPIHVHWAS
eukprot:CAMPEP_0202717974 /NCGR_PEP_ID=MMETSP1385-20130828/117215_1 /ASSEMBLY_ACC=CAM_ASM_000861 /TAXON_ID=933848 /ORGANISM="Elphidium margaritaceum" /LENGTH=79 /DNA_ID=CAMNT_0049380481 /DNA_START=29 /DNA_END=264 /DNA_ORIENTATION=+